MGYNSTYSGVQVDAAVAKHLALENQGGAVSSATLTNLLNNYLDKNEAETTYLSKGVAASTYLTQDNAEANYQKKVDLIFHSVDYYQNPAGNVTFVGAVPWNRVKAAIGPGSWSNGKFIVAEPGIYLATFSFYSNDLSAGRPSVWRENSSNVTYEKCMINGGYGDVTGFFNCNAGDKLCAGGAPDWTVGMSFFTGGGHNMFSVTRIGTTVVGTTTSGAISGNQSLTGLSIGVATPDFASNALEVSGAAKFNGPILTSWNGAKAIGSCQGAATDPAAFINQIRYSNGLMGSVCFNNGGTNWNGISCSSNWYNYIWIPHRFGGDGYGGSSGDNCNYGTLLLFPMTFNGSNYRVRFSGGNVAEVATF